MCLTQAEMPLGRADRGACDLGPGADVHRMPWRPAEVSEIFPNGKIRDEARSCSVAASVRAR